MSCDKLVYDLASETEGSPNVFVRKDWINILDNQNQNYNSNQSVIDTSQLSNSNKWMSYREAYIEVPLLLTIGTGTVGSGTANPGFGGGHLCAGVIGLKNWFGQIVHSLTLDYNGTTIVQQTPFINMWNSFKLMTSLSWEDVKTQGPHIGFYPDEGTSWEYNANASAPSGDGVSNNGLYNVSLDVSSSAGYLTYFNSDISSISGLNGRNVGYARRLKDMVYDPNNIISTNGETNSALLTENNSIQMWRSYVTGRVGSGSVRGYTQHQIMATIYLKHLHSFFNMCPLLKGVYMKMTLNLNNSSAQISATAATQAGAATNYSPGTLVTTSVSNAVGGVVPFMISSAFGRAPRTTPDGPGYNPATEFSAGAPLTASSTNPQTFYANLSVGGLVLDNALNNSVQSVAGGNLAKSIYLYVPAYTFNPVFEQAYLSSPVKNIKYTDVYQFQVQRIEAGSPFSNLITNGIANIKSVLVLPFYSRDNNGTVNGIASYQSPFNPAGCGPTDPLISLNNFNVVISGQNAIYNTERYTFEHFVNQVYGQNAVNGGLTDGITSSLINFKDFQSSYCYYYTNVERMLPVEQSVPKSVQLIGTNLSSKRLDLWVFVEYGVSISIDSITGARV
jgi:hypothetical protein